MQRRDNRIPWSVVENEEKKKQKPTVVSLSQ